MAQKFIKVRYIFQYREPIALKVNYASDAFKLVKHAHDTGTRVDHTGKSAAEIVEDLFSDQPPERRR